LNKAHKAKILAHTPIGKSYYRLVLRAGEAAAAAVPGQFVMLRVSENRDPLLARPLGISSIISKTSIEIVYRVAGRGTMMLSQVEPGHSLDMLGPLGQGFPLPEKGVTPVLIAGGSGFPPLHFLSTRIGPHAHLFIGARNRECLPPADILTSFRKNIEKVHIATEDGSMGKKGMSTDLLLDYLDRAGKKDRKTFFACGPRPMLESVSRLAAEHAVPCYVSVEERMACGVGACMGCSVPVKEGGYKRVCKEGPVFDAREIEWGEQIRLEMPKIKVRS
jgi:dihydroorotate dehydrogenase electron transfer subunit